MPMYVYKSDEHTLRILYIFLGVLFYNDIQQLTELVCHAQFKYLTKVTSESTAPCALRTFMSVSKLNLGILCGQSVHREQKECQ